MGDSNVEDYEEIRSKYNADGQIWDGALCRVFHIKNKPEVLKIIKQSRAIEDAVRERDILQKLQGHRNVTGYLRSDVEMSPHGLNYVMVLDLCDLGTLNNFVVYNLNNEEILSRRHLASFIKDIARGLQYLHEINLVHHNLHPGNILLQWTGNSYFRYPVCKLSGFRCCHYEDSCATSNAEVTCFSPPEHPGQPSTKKSDMFSFGVIICALYNRQIEENTLVAYFNRRRFAEEAEESLTYQALRNYTRNKRMPSLLLNLLQKDPTRRYTADDVLAHLERSQPMRALQNASLYLNCFR